MTFVIEVQYPEKKENGVNSLIRPRPFERMLTAHIEEKGRTLEEAKMREINRHFKKHLSAMHAWAVDNLSLDHILTPEEYADILPRAREWHKMRLKTGVIASGLFGLFNIASFGIAASISPFLAAGWLGFLLLQIPGSYLFYKGGLSQLLKRYIVKPAAFSRCGHYGSFTGKTAFLYSAEEEKAIKEQYIRRFVK